MSAFALAGSLRREDQPLPETILTAGVAAAAPSGEASRVPPRRNDPWREKRRSWPIRKYLLSSSVSRPASFAARARPLKSLARIISESQVLQYNALLDICSVCLTENKHMTTICASVFLLIPFANIPIADCRDAGMLGHRSRQSTDWHAKCLKIAREAAAGRRWRLARLGSPCTTCTSAQERSHDQI